MKKIVIIIFSLTLVLNTSCDKIEKAVAKAVEKEEKSKKKLRNGVLKQFNKDGTVKTEITYKEGLKHGLAKSYYKNGKLRQEINYIDDKKNGAAKTYYENGKQFQTTQYVDDVIHGIRKKYRQNGRLMAEIPYEQGKVCKGLKEYLVNGKARKQYPVIEIEEIDRLLSSNKFTLRIKISDGSKRVKFYTGKLDEGGCIAADLFLMTPTKPGVLEMTFNLQPGTFMMQEMHFVAEVKTKLGNLYLIDRKYNLAIESRG